MTVTEYFLGPMDCATAKQLFNHLEGRSRSLQQRVMRAVEYRHKLGVGIEFDVHSSEIGMLEPLRHLLKPSSHIQATIK